MNGRTALVTGSTDGIGVAIARTLAAEGAQVIVSGRNAERGEQVVQSILDNGGVARFAGADLSSGDGVCALAAAAGPVDILVNNAAMLLAPQPTADVPEEIIDQALTTNVKAVFLLTGLLAPGMADRGSGAIVNVGSINGLVGMAHSALYSATKATIHSLTKSWAAEYGPSGVRVNTIAQGRQSPRYWLRTQRPDPAHHRPRPVAATQHARTDRSRGRVPGERQRREHPRRHTVRRRRTLGHLVAACGYKAPERLGALGRRR